MIFKSYNSKHKPETVVISKQENAGQTLPGIKHLNGEKPSPEKVARRLRELARELPPRQRKKVERAIKRVTSQ